MSARDDAAAYQNANGFILRLTYGKGERPTEGEGEGEETAIFNSAQKFRWWLELYREKKLQPTQVFLQIRFATGRTKLHRFPNVKELKHWVKKHYPPD